MKKRRRRRHVQEDEAVVAQAPKIVGPPTKWVLKANVGFGIINESFLAGTVFTVDWENKKMMNESNGRVFNNIKDLEILINLQNGTVEPLTEDEAKTFLVEKNQAINDARQRRTQETQRNQEELRGRVIQSDEDLIDAIDISHTRKKKEPEPTPKTAPTNIVTLIKPRHHAPVQVMSSEDTQESRRAGGSNVVRTVSVQPDPTIASKHSWDVKEMGRVESRVKQRVMNHQVIMTESGQQIVRGLPVVRDDTTVVGDGFQSLNPEQVRQLTTEERKAYKEQARENARKRRSEVSEKRNKMSKSSDDDGFEQQLESIGVEVIAPIASDQERPVSEKKRVSEKLGKLLGRRS